MKTLLNNILGDIKRFHFHIGMVCLLLLNLLKYIGKNGNEIQRRYTLCLWLLTPIEHSHEVPFVESFGGIVVFSRTQHFAFRARRREQFDWDVSTSFVYKTDRQNDVLQTFRHFLLAILVIAHQALGRFDWDSKSTGFDWDIPINYFISLLYDAFYHLLYYL